MNYLHRLRHHITKSNLRAPLVWLQHRRLDTDDIFVASYPRSGSTWLRFLLLEILTLREPEFTSVNELIPAVGLHEGAPRLLPDNGRLIKTHETFRKEYRRAIYLVRDVRDVVVSEYYFQTWRKLFLGDLDDFLASFLRGRVNGYGAWHDHVTSWINASNTELLTLTFEDLRQDTVSTLKRVLDFLGVDVGLDAIRQAAKNNQIGRMRAKEKEVRDTLFRGHIEGMHFCRQGSAGGWRDELTADQLRSIESTAGETLARLGYEIEQMAH